MFICNDWILHSTMMHPAKSDWSWNLFKYFHHALNDAIILKIRFFSPTVCRILLMDLYRLESLFDDFFHRSPRYSAANVEKIRSPWKECTLTWWCCIDFSSWLCRKEKNTFSQCQLSSGSTEKYAHVTYFRRFCFNNRILRSNSERRTANNYNVPAWYLATV